MRNPLEFERDALRERLTTVTQICRNQEKKIESLEREVHKYKSAGEYYIAMQRDIRANENIRDAWLDFITIYTLATPDIEEIM